MILFIVLCSTLLNIFADPYNYLGSNRTDYITCANERNIKSVYLANNTNAYDGVLIGSSRSSYIDVSNTPYYKIFNYSVSGIGIEEYLPYLLFFKKTQGTPKLIILSLDFHTTNKNCEPFPPPTKVISYAENKFKHFFDYMKVKVAHLSLKILNFERKYFNDYYTRNLVKGRVNQRTSLDDNIIKDTIDYYRRNVFRNYIYREDYVKILWKLKEAFPNSKIIVLICPIHNSLTRGTFNLVNPLFYQKWNQDIKNIFRKFYDFNNDQSIVKNKNFFFDPSHFYPFIGDKIISVLENEFKK